jgi:hypothetical protein
MKKLLSVYRVLFLGFCCFLVYSSSFAQEVEWQNTIGGSLGDYFSSIESTSDGGFIIGGYSNSNISGDKTENAVGAYDYWIVKIDAIGNLQWQNTIGGSSGEQLADVHQTSDNGYILVGSSYSNASGDKSEPSIGGDDYWIVKTDSLGNIEWQNTIGGTLEDIATCAAQSLDGGYLIGGYSESNISGDKTENNIGSGDIWIIKTDSQGNVQWDNTIGGTSMDRMFSVKATPDGGYILGGCSGSNISGDKTENSNGSLDYWIVKIDASGNIEWQNTIGGNFSDELDDIDITDDGGYIVGGFSFSEISGDKTEPSYDTDCWILKLDSIGNIQWQQTIGGSMFDNLKSIEKTNDGGYILGGYSISNISYDKSENIWDGFDYWVIKTDSFGIIEWQNNIGGSNPDQFASIKETADGKYIVGGFSSSPISGDKTENSTGEDFWILCLNESNIIEGKIFMDSNNNSVQDSGEYSVPNRRVVESNSARFAFSNQIGKYQVAIFDTGNFQVSPLPINYYSCLPLYYAAYFSGILQTDSLNDFAFYQTDGSNDLCITISPSTLFRSGREAQYTINYQNVGTTILNPTVIFYVDTNFTFGYSNPPASLITNDSVVWNFNSMLPTESAFINVHVIVDQTTPVNTLISSNVRIEPLVGDENDTCNLDISTVRIVASYDPNEILVSRETIFSSELATPPFLNYIIYFQNTGNDTAFNVKVLNPIDTNKLQLSTLEFVASSHPMNMQWISWERNMEFKFDNILLPDSNINEAGSHGFVRYRIKPKTTLAANDTIKNTAYIYFDFNPPVPTNTALTHIVLTTKAEELHTSLNGFSIYPNPTANTFTIQCQLQDAELKISDVTGRVVLEQKINSESSIFNSPFSKGIYFVRLSNDERSFTQKLVIE